MYLLCVSETVNICISIHKSCDTVTAYKKQFVPDIACFYSGASTNAIRSRKHLKCKCVRLYTYISAINAAYTTKQACSSTQLSRGRYVRI